MAYLRKIKTGWRAEVERAGARRSAVFETRREAELWARRVETELLAGKTTSDKLFSDTALRYEKEVTAKKRGARWEQLRIPKMIAHFDGLTLAEIDAGKIAGWRDARLRDVSASTVLRESKLLHNILAVARQEWGWLDADPFTGVKMPRHDPPRHQRWGWREIRRVLRYLNYVTGQKPQSSYQQVALAFLISLRTAMRAGEVLKVSPATLDAGARVVTLADTKTAKRVQIPLTRQGARVCALADGWTINSALLDALFRKARDNSLVSDLRFHDARATALTMLARKYDVLVLSRISGHKNLKMLSDVYYRATAGEIAARL